MSSTVEPEGFPVCDPRGVEVHCRPKNWNDHEKKHPAITDRSVWAAETIREAQRIYRSYQKPSRLVYYKAYPFPRLGPMYMRVITDEDTDSGVVWLVTAMNVIELDAWEAVIWRAP